jgi:bifunctional DNA-binding transcriptional regulator/antitoxin component of YhaV-PrlF toxin-antitoxin module
MGPPKARDRQIFSSLAQFVQGGTKQVYTLNGGIMETVTLPDGHVVLPLELRRRMEIDNGTRFDIEIDIRKGIIILKPISCEYDAVVRKRGSRKVELPARLNRYRAKSK